jgi:signal transduction histidine kinase
MEPFRKTLDDISRLLGEQDSEPTVATSWRSLLPLLGKIAFPDGYRASGLWLVDDVGEERLFTLWLTHRNAGEAGDGPMGLSFATSKVTISENDLADPDPDRSALLRALDLSGSEVSAWATHMGFPGELPELVLPIFNSSMGGGDVDLVGIVTFLGDATNRSLRIDKYPNLLSLGRTIGAWMRFNRRSRALLAIDEFQSKIASQTSLPRVCETAAEILVRLASARAGCAIYAHADADGLKPIAWVRPEGLLSTSPPKVATDSPIHLFHMGLLPLPKDGILYVKDAGNPAAVRDQIGVAHDFGLQEPDAISEQIVTLMAIRVTCRSSSGAAAPFMTIVMLTYADSGFIGGRFSNTNIEILRRVSLYLQNIAPELALREGMGDLTKLVQSEKKTVSVRIIDERRDIDRSRFAKMVEDHVPSVVECHIVDTVASPSHQVIADREGLVPNVPDWHSHVVRHGFRSNPTTPSGPYSFREQVFDHDGRRVELFCRLSSPILLEHEGLVFERIQSEFELALVRHLNPDEWLKQIAEIRHNLRNSVNSVVGQAAAVSEHFNGVRDRDEANVYKRLVLQPKFRKDIDLLRLASNELFFLFESGKVLLSDFVEQELQLSDIDIAELIRLYINLSRPEATRRGVDVVFDNNWNDYVGRIQGDRALLAILIFNLIDNAIKYSHRGHRVVVRLWPQRQFWSLSVANEGTYLPPARADEIFLTFRRLRPVRGQQMMPGTGLGLPAVKAIADAHSRADLTLPRGRPVVVESIPVEIDNAGVVVRGFTRFTVTLPRRGPNT